MAYLYRHIRLDKNEPFYIGIGSDSAYKRAYEKSNRNKYWKNISNKTEYQVEIILEDLTWEEACEKEKEFIKLYGRILEGFGTLCNITEGGDGVLGMKHTEETKNKIRKDNKRPEKMLVCMENLKKMQTPEAKAKALANRDYSFSKKPEVIAKRKANTDYKAIGKKIGKPVLQYNMEGVLIKEWESAYQAYKECGYNFGHIHSCCKGKDKYKSTGGYIWKYKNNK
jgi:hypothetical protein